MSRPSSLVVKWRAYKAKQRRTGYYARGLMRKTSGGFDQFKMRTEDAMQYHHRVGDGVRLAELTKIVLVQLLESKFDHFNYVIHRETDSGFAWLFFSGQEYFIIEKKDVMYRMSNIYASKENLIQRWECNALTWIKKVFVQTP